MVSILVKHFGRYFCLNNTVRVVVQVRHGNSKIEEL